MAASKLAMLSGKGGSGKTTLSLMLAKTMSAAGLKTLLVDCDMATHGLTYFFEGDLGENILSLTDCVHLFQGESATKESREFNVKCSTASLISVDDKCEFIPSIIRVSDNAEFGFDDCIGAIQWIIERYDTSFDLIIFDGQAGYSPFVQAIANVSDVILFVMELDSISVSATRVLYRRLCNGNDESIDERNLYQVINKLDEEDRETFTKVVIGTMFENLPPLRFDWSIRRAFAECRIPNMASTHIELLYSVTSIITQLFPKFRNSLHKSVGEQSLAYEKILLLKIEEIQRDKYILPVKYLSLLLILIVTILFSNYIVKTINMESIIQSTDQSIPMVMIITIYITIYLIYLAFSLSIVNKIMNSIEPGFLKKNTKTIKETRSQIKELREQRKKYT